MTKILLIGSTPPQLIKNTKVDASHYRTWQFLQPLLEDGHRICLCAEGGAFEDSSPSLPEPWREQLSFYRIPFRRWGWVADLRKVIQSFSPDCILAVNFESCKYVTKLHTTIPIWMDIYGDYLTIIQAARYRGQSNRGISTSIAFMRRVLEKGDVFSVCSTMQSHALVGELAMAGRLNYLTFGYQFQRVILPGSPPKKDFSNRDERKKEALKRLGIREDDFLVLWCGGYNTWTDVCTLYSGLVWAMERDPDVHFLSVGANTYSAPDNVYDQLLKLIGKSEYRDRFHMLGWRPWEEINDYYIDSEVGVNIDALHYETIYGTRTRLVEMISAGLPVITTAGTELSEILREGEVANTFDIGDSDALGKCILSLASNPEKRQQMSVNAYWFAKDRLSFANTTLPAREWVQSPHSAPDKGVTGTKDKVRNIEYFVRTILRLIVWGMFGLER